MSKGYNERGHQGQPGSAYLKDTLRLTSIPKETSLALGKGKGSGPKVRLDAGK